jgi:hypothetical protein
MAYAVLSAAATIAGITTFDGKWVFHRFHTTPKGLHNEGLDTLLINMSGTSTETIDQFVTMVDRTGRSIAPKIRIVQVRRSLKTEFAGGVLTIHWSALELIKSRSDKIPSGLHIAVGPCSATCRLRRDRLAVTIDNATDLFTYVK